MATTTVDIPVRTKTDTNTAVASKTTIFTLSQEDREKLYQPLTGEQTRFLKIHPADNFEADVVCELVTKDIALEEGAYPDEETGVLPGIVQYEALSYCWGSPIMDRTIECNDIRFPVTQTLLDALRHVRRKEDHRLLWTDLICINQQDLDEKANQVQMMFTIFQRALKVIAWIGPPTEEDELICTIADQLEDDLDHVGAAMNQLDMPMKAYLEEGETCPNTERAKKAAWAFITSRPFFQRTWVRQEVFAARNLDMICGKYVFAFKRFTNVLDSILPDQTTGSSRFINSDDLAARALLCYSYLRTDHEKFEITTSITLDQVWFETVMRSTMYQSTLPQDKVFGVLGMMQERTIKCEDPYDGIPENDITIGFPEPDYKAPVSLIYQNFVKHHINKSTSLKCLSIFQKRDSNGKDIPSWGVDLRVDTPRYLVPGQFFEWGINWDDHLPEQSFDAVGELEVRGVRIGTIGKGGSGPWAKDYPRSVMGMTSPMLQSCVHGDEHWFAEEDDETDRFGRGKDYNHLLDVGLGRLERDCGYSWKSLDKIKSIPLGTSQTYRWASKQFHFHIFAHDSVQDGDVVVDLGGAEVPFVIRQSEDKGKWRFLGPAMLTKGCFDQKNMKDGQPVFEHDMTHIRPENFEWDENAEDFVLV